LAFDKPLYLRGFQPTRSGGRLGAVLGSVFVLAIVGVNWAVFFRGAGVAAPTLEQRLAKPVEVPAEPEPLPQQPEASPEARMVEGALVRGETASQALARLGVASGSAHGALTELGRLVDMKTLKAGQKLVLSVMPDGKVRSLTFPLTETAYVEVNGADGGFVAERKEIATDKQTVSFACVIRGSLFESLQRCGEDQGLAIVVTDLLAGQVDFFSDSRRGDVLRASIEKESLSGRFLRYGKVKGLVYEGRVANGSVFPLESAAGEQTYYDASGEAVERPFLRAPLRYSRLSSDYSLKRLHPILHKFTAHRAQDYAAPKGTPVYAVGDGKVVFAGAKGANGNLVVLEHQGGWQTYYAHLSHFAKGAKAGERVSKKTLIGFVGSTGRSTGPHLHFAVAKDGAFVHPRKLLSMPGQRVPAAEAAAFRDVVDRVTTELKALPVRGLDGTRS